MTWGWEKEKERRAYERAQIWSAVFTLLGFAALMAGFIGALVTMNPWWLIGAGVGFFTMLIANPDDW